MKKVIILLLLYLFLSECHKADESSDNKDTLVQYFQCTLNDNIQFDYKQNDSVNIGPSYSILNEGGKITYTFYSKIGIGRKLDQYQTAYDNIGIGFVTTPQYDEIDWTNKIYKNNKIESFFQPGNIPFLEQKCPDLIIQPQVFFYAYYTSYTPCLPMTFINNCNYPNNPPIHNEGYFTINKSEPYSHQKYGKCILIEGTFEVTQYSVSGTSMNQLFKIKDGRFKLLVH